MLEEHRRQLFLHHITEQCFFSHLKKYEDIMKKCVEDSISVSLSLIFLYIMFYSSPLPKNKYHANTKHQD